jgi:hypothetical protein
VDDSCSLFRILAGLPGDGPYPEQFSATGLGMHSEGIVVEFMPDSEQSWIGNFQPGGSALTAVVAEGGSVVVVARGRAYIIDPISRKLLGTLGGSVETLDQVEGGVLVSNGIGFELIGQGISKWRSKRLSWDGMRNIQVHGGLVSGEGWFFDDSWHIFYVKLSDGSSSGGAYHGPEL